MLVGSHLEIATSGIEQLQVIFVLLMMMTSCLLLENREIFSLIWISDNPKCVRDD